MIVTNAEARRHGHDTMDASHLLLGVIGPDGSDSPARTLLNALGVDPTALRQRVHSTLGPAAPSTPDELRFAPDARAALDGALREAVALGSWGIGPEHVL